ncbi:MAG: nicotinate (nicotinamide) nucleotide adenylyltransferase [Oligoflexia bacterium]|nr:nicotinate (nicotinamide) nucleotide adenylyltransferase [Oligoflexia bacterium]
MTKKRTKKKSPVKAKASKTKKRPSATKKVILKKKAAPVAKTKKSDEIIGILGGSFNPIHIGHLHIALSVKERLGLSKVVFIPSFASPMREPAGIHPDDRLKMVELAAERYRDDLAVDPIEVKRGGVSYTVDTLKAYNKKYKPENLYFIMGADSFLKFPQWKNFEELLSLANWVVCVRPGAQVSLTSVDLPSGLEQHIVAADERKVVLKSGRTISLVENDPIAVSSSEIRKKIRQGQSVQSLLTPKVHDFILENKLYQRTSPLVSDYKKFTLMCAESALDKKALGLKVYDLSRLSSYTDYSIVCSATSTKHAAAVAEGVIKTVKEEFGINPISVEGLREGRWVLVDFGAAVLHVFEDTLRGHYKIEELWRACPQIQSGAP